MTARLPFPEVVDSTIIAAWKSCQQRGHLQYMQHWKPKGISVHLHAGGAFASGVEAARRAYFIDGAPEAEAVAIGLGALLRFYGDFTPPEDSAKTAARMAGALEFYFDQYPLSKDGVVPIKLADGNRAIEFSFAEPTDIAHPTTGDPIIYSGRLDTIGEFVGRNYGLDEKTTTQLGASWGRQWDLRSQFTGYCWGSARGGVPLDGFIVRGVSILKTKYETQQAITYRPDWMIERWYLGLCETLIEMISAWKRDHYRFNLDTACTEYGGCPFRKVCLSEDPEPWLNAEFDQRMWDPIHRREIPIQMLEGVTI